MSTNYIGTAGWSIPKAHSEKFPGKGTHLEKYSQRLQAVEVNSSFYRDHQEATYYRWSYSTPPQFRFSVKFPRRFTHEGKLSCTPEEAKNTLEPIFGLKEKLGVILVQLPPKLAFDLERATAFFETIRSLYQGKLACEPRHPSWGEESTLNFFERFKISKVQADPEPCPALAARLTTAGGFQYFRLHGSPEVYRSPYQTEFLAAIARKIQSGRDWCIFDNTTFGHATENALELTKILSSAGRKSDDKVA